MSISKIEIFLILLGVIFFGTMVWWAMTTEGYLAIFMYDLFEKIFQ